MFSRLASGELELALFGRGRLLWPQVVALSPFAVEEGYRRPGKVFRSGQPHASAHSQLDVVAVAQTADFRMAPSAIPGVAEEMGESAVSHMSETGSPQVPGQSQKSL